jgi:hypothetical protein
MKRVSADIDLLSSDVLNLKCFWQHSAFVSSVFFPEQTAITYPYNVSWQVFWPKEDMFTARCELYKHDLFHFSFKRVISRLTNEHFTNFYVPMS